MAAEHVLDVSHRESEFQPQSEAGILQKKYERGIFTGLQWSINGCLCFRTKKMEILLYTCIIIKMKVHKVALVRFELQQKRQKNAFCQSIGNLALLKAEINIKQKSKQFLSSQVRNKRKM